MSWNRPCHNLQPPSSVIKSYQFYVSKLPNETVRVRFRLHPSERRQRNDDDDDAQKSNLKLVLLIALLLLFLPLLIPLRHCLNSQRGLEIPRRCGVQLAQSPLIRRDHSLFRTDDWTHEFPRDFVKWRRSQSQLFIVVA